MWFSTAFCHLQNKYRALDFFFFTGFLFMKVLLLFENQPHSVKGKVFSVFTPFYPVGSERRQSKPQVGEWNEVVWGWCSTDTKCHWSWCRGTLGHAVWVNFKGPLRLTWKNPARERYLNAPCVIDRRYFSITASFNTSTALALVSAQFHSQLL